MKSDAGRIDTCNLHDSGISRLQNATFVHEVDLLSDEAGPEFLTAHDVRVLLGIPRSDRFDADGEGGF